MGVANRRVLGAEYRLCEPVLGGSALPIFRPSSPETSALTRQASHVHHFPVNLIRRALSDAAGT